MSSDYVSYEKDENNRKGIVLKKDNVYFKAWNHDNVLRWDDTKYGKMGHNVIVDIIDENKVEYIKLDILKFGEYILEVKDLLNFYSENRKTKVNIFGEQRYLFPLVICKKIK